MADSNQLLPEVAAQFRCTIIPCRIELQRLGRTIDLRTLTLAEAQELVLNPLFSYLVPLQTKKRAARRSTAN